MSLLSGLLDVVLPPVCGACGQAGRAPFCRVCGEALLEGEPFELPGLERSRALFVYGGPVALALAALKYEGRQDVGRAFEPLLQAELQTFETPDLVLPIPLSKKKLRTRGYNQAFELCRSLHPRPDPRLLIRLADGRPQVGLKSEERHKNVSVAFGIAHPELVKGRRILLIDDVVTTGATAQAAAAVCHKAGAQAVDLLTVARAEVGTWGV